MSSEFSRSEYEARWRRTREALGAAGLDALLVTSEANYRYLSGHHTGFWLSKSRPMWLLLPRDGEPVLLVTTNQVAQAEAMSPVTAIRAWDGFLADGIPVLADAVRQAGLGRARIGAELGFEQRLGMPVAEFERLKGLVPHRAFLVELFRGGAERPGYIPITSGAGNYQRRTGGPTDRKLEAGDLLWQDGGCSYQGYWSDFSRMAAIGRATREQAATYRAVREMTHGALAAVRPGRPFAEVVGEARREFERRRLPWGATSRIGHAIGLDLTEPPSLRADVPDVFEPGMVLTIEPTVVADHGLYQLEEIYVVTETGAELLTAPSDPELRVIA
jgi:Xaa-Pro aminopeptidase